MKLSPVYITLLMMIYASDSFPSPHGQDAKDSKESSGIPVAVMEIQAHNCSPSLAMAVRDMLYHRLFESGIFILLEKEKTDIFLKESHLDQEECESLECLSRFGKKTAVKKVITGSLSRLHGYRVDLRIVDTGKGTVDLSMSHNSRGEAGLEHAVSRMVERAQLFYAGYTTVTGKINATLNTTFMYPVGELASLLDGGPGVSLDIRFNDIIRQRYPLIFSAGFFMPGSYYNSVDHFYMFPLTLAAGYPVQLSGTVRMTTEAGGGYLVSHVRYDTVEVRTHGNHEYSEGLFFNPMLTGRCSFEILLGHRWYLNIAPSYIIFFDSGKPWQLVSLNTGITMLF